MQSLNIDVLVIGAGPSGSIAASIVRKAGYNVHMVEKEKFPRFVIGESLLPRCMEALEEAELLDVVKQQGFQEKFGAKFLRNNDVCDFNFDDQHTDGFKWTWQVPRGDFDKALADEVARKGVTVHFETTVTNIVFEETKCFETKKKKVLPVTQYCGNIIRNIQKTLFPRKFTQNKCFWPDLSDSNF